MKRRPTADDRNLANVFHRLNPGEYKLDVENTTKNIQYLGLAKLKSEGSVVITLEDKTIYIVPVSK